MTATAAAYANWKAPAHDRQHLLWPDRTAILHDTTQNAELLNHSAQVHLLGIPLPELRSATRRTLGFADMRRPLIASGHQTELYHAGVWVKDVLAGAIADKLGGCAVHFAVDTDQPKHLSLRWPGMAIPLTDSPTSAAWSAMLRSPGADHLEEIERELAGAIGKWGFEPMLGQFLNSLKRQAWQAPGLCEALTQSQHELDSTLGLKHEARLASTLMNSDSYLAFAHHILSNAERFAADYNAALAEYRKSAGIHSSSHPMPDLRISSNSIETPFWFDDLSRGVRARAQLSRSGDSWVLNSDVDEFVPDGSSDGWTAAANLGAWLKRNNLRLSPRALTLTMFLRLIVADQFVHGIGGGRYDQVTDSLIHRHFGMTPPRFAVTTATLWFPAAAGRQRVCLSCLAHEGHHLRHSLLGERKNEILSELTALPRRSPIRALVYQNMHAALSAAEQSSADLQQWRSRYQRAQQRDRQDQFLFDRELFYARTDA